MSISCKKPSIETSTQEAATNNDVRDADNKDPCAFAFIPKPAVPPEPEPVQMALLPPDHPLLLKFQENLRQYLTRTRDELKEEIEDIKYRIKTKEQEREEQGANLYDRQQEMNHQHEQLEEFATKIAEHTEQRTQEEAVVDKLKKEYDAKMKTVKDSKTFYNKRVVELEQLNVLENNINEWARELDDEVKNAQRMVNRDAEIQQQMSVEKKKADLLFYHLDVQVKKNEKELESIHDEIANMNETISVLNQSTTCANTDLEVLQNEHKRLNQAWGQVIVAISHRDKLLYQLNTDINKQKEDIKLCGFSIEAIKKQINKELTQNEKLKAFKLRLYNDFLSLKRDCQKQSNILAELEDKLDQLPQWLAQTQKDMDEARREGNVLQNDIHRIQWKLDKEYNKKYLIEETILKLAEDQLVTDKASEYRHKLLNSARDLRRKLELQLAQAQNQLSQLLLDLGRNKNTTFKMRQENDTLKDKLDYAEKKSDQLNAELKSLEDQIDLKMKRIEKLNNDLDAVKHASQNIANSPLEVKIVTLEKTIQSAEQQIRDHQRFWLMLQNHYVNLSQKRSNQLNEIQVTRKQLAIIKQKSLKIDYDLELSEQKAHELTREINVYRSKVQLLNGKLAIKQQAHENVESNCEMEHGELINRLKNHEMGVLKLEDEINEIKIEIDYLKDLVLDKHREALAWETKYKLVEETIRWRKDESTLNSEIGTMKTEIHRMQIRHNQLKRAQEKLIADLEQCLMHREHIFITASNRQRIENNPQRSLQNTSVQQKILDLRNKLRQIQEEIGIITEERLNQNTRNYECAKLEIKDLNERIEREMEQYDLLRAEIDESMQLKFVNLENIVRKQNRAKAYQKLKSTLPAPKFRRSETSINSMMQQQIDIGHNLREIIHELMNEIPEQKPYFVKILQTLQI